MPKRTDIRSIMIIGAGPIVIGQACEFDYSGAQACKALREEGYRVILVNSNPATIMTDPGMADATYIEPITPEVVAKIIEKERPDALLPTMGGQTGLNTALALADMGVLDKFNVELIGAKREAIEMAEDRKLFREAMDRIGLENPKATIVTAPKLPNGKPDLKAGVDECLEALEHIGLPAIIRPAFTLGGTGGGVAYNREDFEAHLPVRPRRLPRRPDPDRRKPSRLEGIRDGGGARHRRQPHHRLLDRERRSDGRPYRRQHHRRPGADADRQGIPDHAQRQHRRAARDRRRDRRVERPMGRSTPQTAAWW